MKPKLTGNYQQVLAALKEKIRSARIHAVVSVNVQLLQMYWEVGQVIAEQEKKEGWGARVIKTLSQDLAAEFPDMQGFSVRNLQYMRAFAIAYPHFSILQAPLAKLPKRKTKTPQNPIVQVPLAQLSWYHHITLLDKVKTEKERLFYITETIRNGWSRNVLVHQIESGLYQRQGKALTNFSNTIAPAQSELTQQLFKDPFKFEFVYLSEEARERDLEDALTSQITKFLLELGQWFAFMGRQYKVNVGDKEFRFDLLFYHTRLKRYIVIDLKIDEFKPEYAGKMNFYLTAADENLRQEGDGESIGLILCKTKDGLVAEYALRNTNKPIGISEYTISKALPKNIKGELPTIREIEQRMDEEMKELQTPADKKYQRLQKLITKLGKEPLKEKKNPQYCIQLFENLLLPLKEKLQKKLKEKILGQFETADWVIYLDGPGFTNEKEARERMPKSHTLNSMTLDLQLKGFKPAGTDAFSIYTGIHIELNDYFYTISSRRNDQDVWLKNLYHQTPGPKQVNEIVEKFCEVLYENMEQQLNRILKK
jgi:predicted nuclease of restriction endonuclease-like (RecB) superfamily